MTYKLQFDYRTYKQHQMNLVAQDAHTFCACSELLLRNIHTVQLDHRTIQLESARDRSYALLLLSNDPLRTVRVLDDQS